jgi:hypothetical protein
MSLTSTSTSMVNMSLMIREETLRGLTSPARDLVIRAVSECASKYGFSADEALRLLCLDDVSCVVNKKSRGVGVEKKKAVRSAFPLPYNGESDTNLCSGLRFNEGLYTQCILHKKEEKSFCKGCQVKADTNDGVPQYGTITHRKVCYDSNTEFKDPNGKSPVAYCRIMKKYKLSEEQVVEEATKQGMTVNTVHFVFVECETKRGRPKSNVPPKELKGTKGRPKKSKKVLEIDGCDDDLFASLIASVNEEASETASETGSETASETASVKATKEAEKATKEAEKATKEAEKATKEAEKKAEKATKEAEKKAEKATKEAEKQAEKATKEAEKQAEKAEKATKEAEKQAEKATKEAEKKAEKEAEKATKEAEKAQKTAEKALKETEKRQKPDNEPDVVKRFEFEGNKYLKSKNTGIIYNIEQDVIGKWNDTTNKIDFNPEEDEYEYEEEDEEEEDEEEEDEEEEVVS